MLRRLRSYKMFTVGLLLVLSMISSVLALTESTNAASIYDDYYQKTAQIKINANNYYGKTCEDQDLSATWASYILDKSKWYHSTYNGDADVSFQNALNHGRWAVSMRNQWGQNGYFTAIHVAWTEDTSLALDWDSANERVSLVGNNLHEISISPQTLVAGDGSCMPIAWSHYTVPFSVISTKQPYIVNPVSNNEAGGFTSFFVNTDSFNYPIGYAGEQITTSPPPPRNYVALGDSFSSGEGNPPFEAGTENDCHRSSAAYPRLLESSLYLDLTNFAACAGAKTSDIDDDLDDQILALSQDTDIVTLTIGGNDVQFGTFATACTVSLCDFGTQVYQDVHDNIANSLPARLADAYEAIDRATSNDAKIYVVGYPYLLPEEMPTGANSACAPFNGGFNDPDPTQNNGAAAYAVQTQLNNAIQQAVSDYGSLKFQYVDPNEINSPFIGHDWCSQDRYFNIVTLNSTSYSYHPNVSGHAAYKTILKDFVQ